MRIMEHAAFPALWRRAALTRFPGDLTPLLGRAERQTSAGAYVRS